MKQVKSIAIVLVVLSLTLSWVGTGWTQESGVEEIPIEIVAMQLQGNLVTLEGTARQVDGVAERLDAAISDLRQNPPRVPADSFFDVFFPLEMKSLELKRDALDTADDAAKAVHDLLEDVIDHRIIPPGLEPIEKTIIKIKLTLIRIVTRVTIIEQQILIIKEEFRVVP